MGVFSIPTVKRSPNGILALVLCILLGGIGTIIIGAIDDRGNDKKGIIITGVLQIVTTLLLGLGYVWAVIWGIMVMVKSN